MSIVDAKHNPKNNDARKNAEIKSKDFDPQGNLKTVIEEKRKAFHDYKIAFKAWKTAKEAYKAAKSR